MREELITRMIHLYGFEHSAVIQFVELCESFEENPENESVLYLLVECHELDPLE